MILDRAAREKLVRALAASMIEHAEELTSLDQAIGDGDHGRGGAGRRSHDTDACNPRPGILPRRKIHRSYGPGVALGVPSD